MKNNKGIIALIIVIIAILTTLCILFATGTISLNLNNDNTNHNNYDGENQIDQTIYQRLIGTYYNSNYDNYYFKLKENGKADILPASCGETKLPLMEGTYRIVKQINSTIILEINYYEGINTTTYIGFPAFDSSGEGRFKFVPTITGCVEDFNTSYEIKNN